MAQTLRSTHTCTLALPAVFRVSRSHADCGRRAYDSEHLSEGRAIASTAHRGGLFLTQTRLLQCNQAAAEERRVVLGKLSEAESVASTAREEAAREERRRAEQAQAALEVRGSNAAGCQRGRSRKPPV